VRAILEHDVDSPKITSDSCVQTYVNERNELAVNSEFWASHVISRNGRMMTDLFIVDWNSLDVALESLSKDGIERFLHQ
jgi:hypothetical protein